MEVVTKLAKNNSRTKIQTTLRHQHPSVAFGEADMFLHITPPNRGIINTHRAIKKETMTVKDRTLRAENRRQVLAQALVAEAGGEAEPKHRAGRP